MSSATPSQSLLGGVFISLTVHAFRILTGNVFGISGLLHRSARGNLECSFGIIGLLLGGLYLGMFSSNDSITVPSGHAITIASALLVGAGSKMANGCTSGHMIAGLSRLSKRSILATAIFFLTGVPTARLFHPDGFQNADSHDWSLGPNGQFLLTSQAAFLSLIGVLFLMRRQPNSPDMACSDTQKLKTSPSNEGVSQSTVRLLAHLLAGLSFAVALHLSNLTDRRRVLSFLSLHPGFDSSLLYLAAGAVPLAVLLNQLTLAYDQPRPDTSRAIQGSKSVDLRLCTGAAMFGIGWGLGGICPGPGIVNVGRALGGGSNVKPLATWVVFVVIGGVVV